MGTQIPGVGGVPDTIANGATKLAQVANAVESTTSGYATTCSQASTAAGDPGVSAAIDRLQAAFSHYGNDLAAQWGALSMLAGHASEDLATAGGQTQGPTVKTPSAKTARPKSPFVIPGNLFPLPPPSNTTGGSK